MPYVWTDDEDDDEVVETQAQKPAELPEPARKHLRGITKERDALKKELEELKAASRKATVADIVKAKGFDPKVASFLPAELDGHDAVEKWLEDNGSMFNKATNDAGQEQSQAAPEGLSPEVAAQLATVTKVTSEGMSPTKLQNLGALISGANSKEELDKLFGLPS